MPTIIAAMIDSAEVDLVQGEEDRRPGEVEDQAEGEQDQRPVPPLRALGVEQHRQRQAEQDVEDRPDDAEHPAGRHEVGLGERREPGIVIAGIGERARQRAEQHHRRDGDQGIAQEAHPELGSGCEAGHRRVFLIRRAAAAARPGQLAFEPAGNRQRRAREAGEARIKQRDQEQGDQGRDRDAEHDDHADRGARRRAGAAGEHQRHRAGDGRDRGHQDRPQAPRAPPRAPPRRCRGRNRAAGWRTRRSGCRSWRRGRPA